MKYYTKEWYNMMQLWGLGDEFEAIEDRVYSDDEIQSMYDAKLAKEIAEEEEFFNTPPDYGLWEEILKNPDEVDLEDFAIINEETDEFYTPKSIDEIVADLKYEYERDLEAFNNRGEYDPSEAIECFESAYEAGLNNARDFYPSWMAETVDPRLIALGYLPASAQARYSEEMAEVEAEWNRINEAFEEFNASQDIDEELVEKFDLHDGELVALEEDGDEILMTIDRCGMWCDDEESEVTIRFRNAEIIEKEETIKPGNSFLYFELHRRAGGGYEVHMMFFTEEWLGYLTIGCEEIC